ncbi:hypothetical protein B0T10DRAFT_439939, partial [Thelonectria olida]
MPDLVNLVRPRLFNRYSGERSNSPVTIDWKVESVPTIILGNEEEDLPSLLSGQVSLKIGEDQVEIDSFRGSLNVHTTQKKPFKSRCANCKDQHEELQAWSFLSGETTLSKGSHSFPFSALIPDHAPASMDNPLLSVSYDFQCEVQFRSKGKPNSTPQTARFNREITIRRSLSIPDGPAHSTRSFPSAGIEVSSHIDSIVHPEAPSKASITLKGLRRSSGTDENIEMWRLWKGAWKLEEKMKTVVKPCERHEATNSDGDGDLLRTKTRLLREKSLYDGWTITDADGTAQLDFGFGIKRSSSSQPTYSNDTKSLDGTEVTHLLTVELVLIKETFPEDSPNLAVRTGGGRILRLHYRVAMVDDSITGPGCVIENLPSYHDIWPSPPSY